MFSFRLRGIKIHKCTDDVGFLFLSCGWLVTSVRHCLRYDFLADDVDMHSIVGFLFIATIDKERPSGVYLRNYFQIFFFL